MIFFFTALLAMGVGLYVTPLTARAARDLGIVAKPDGVLRVQEKPVPYLGGVAIYLAMLASLAVAADFNASLLGLLLGATLMLMVGLIDDFGVMTPKMKLLGQLIASVALIKGGVVMDLEIFKAVRWPADLPLLSWGLSVLWLVGVANAFNFLDIEDGLCGGVAAGCLPALIAVALLNGRMDAAIFSVALLGATMAFLAFNAPFPSAKIYLGDAGSLFLGMCLPALAMIGSYSEKNDLAAVCPVIILGVPCFELGVTMAARWRRGIPVWQGSPDHIAKRLQRAGWPKRTVIFLHWGTSLVLGGLAVLIMRLDIEMAMGAVATLALTAIVFALLLLRINVDAPGKGAQEEIHEP